MARPRVVIAGVSTRALAESAHASGFGCFAIDAFGDLDQRQWATTLGLRRDLGQAYSAPRAVAAARRFEAEHVAYVGNFENHPAAVGRLAQGRSLLGNAPASLRLARDPRALAAAVERAGGRVPRTLFPGEVVPARGHWLGKPVRGGGGQGVRDLAAGERVGPRRIAQERIAGVAASVSFLADGRRGLVLGIARGLAGDPAFGSRSYRYCGSLLPFSVAPRVRERLEAVVQEATRAFGLVGLNGIDVVLAGEQPFVLEINPRFSASMELIERGGARDLFQLHAEACRGQLPDRAPTLAAGCWGKAIVWASSPVEMPDTRSWLAREDVRDVPFPGERIGRGQPICSVLAHAPDLDACYTTLVERARRVEDMIRAGTPA